MTDEKFKQLLELKDKIEKTEFDLNTVDYLLKSKSLSTKIEGISECKFKVSRYIYLSDDSAIKSILENLKITFRRKIKTITRKIFKRMKNLMTIIYLTLFFVFLWTVRKKRKA